MWSKAVDSEFNVQPECFKNIWNLRGLISNAYSRVTVSDWLFNIWNIFLPIILDCLLSKGMFVTVSGCFAIPKLNSTKSNQDSGVVNHDWQKCNLDLWNQINAAHLLQRKLICAAENSIRPNLSQNLHENKIKSHHARTNSFISCCGAVINLSDEDSRNFPRPGCFCGEPQDPVVKLARNVRPVNSGRTPHQSFLY